MRSVNVRPIAAYRQTQKSKFAAWPSSWRPPGADRLSLKGPILNSHIWLCTVDDSTTNMVLCIIIITIIIIFLPSVV